VPAHVQDVLPSKAERFADQIVIANRPARVRIRYRTDLNSSMRVIYGDRTMEIISGPSEIGRHEWLELVCQEFSTAGDAP